MVDSGAVGSLISNFPDEFRADTTITTIATTIADAEAYGGALDANYLQAKAEIAGAGTFLSERAGPSGGLRVHLGDPGGGRELSSFRPAARHRAGRHQTLGRPNNATVTHHWGWNPSHLRLDPGVPGCEAKQDDLPGCC